MKHFITDKLCKQILSFELSLERVTQRIIALNREAMMMFRLVIHHTWRKLLLTCRLMQFDAFHTFCLNARKGNFILSLPFLCSSSSSNFSSFFSIFLGNVNLKGQTLYCKIEIEGFKWETKALVCSMSSIKQKEKQIVNTNFKTVYGGNLGR